MLPACRRRFATMMAMSRQATAACHERGLHVVLKIAKDDARRGSLRAWATRQGYTWYAEDAEVDWYVSYAPRHQPGHAEIAPPLPIVDPGATSALPRAV